VEMRGARPAYVSRSEFAVVIAIVAAFLVICFATISRFPIVWGDEAYFAEPAVNANLGMGFTSFMNSVQPHGRFWAGNTPLYSMLLTGWLKVFGIGIVQVRSFGYVLAALAVVMFWWATARLGLITSAGMRIAFIVTLLLAYGPGFCIRAVRYDTLSMLLVSLTMVAASLGSTRLRLGSIVALGALFTMTQLTLVTYSAEIGVLLLCFYGRAYFREIVALGIGTILGGALLYALLQSQGAWPDLVAFIRHQRTIRQGGVPKDPSFPLILAAACCLALDQYRRGDFRWRSPLVFGLTAGIGVPLGQLAYGWFPTNYTWMAILPLACGIFSEFSRALSLIGPLARSAAVAALGASALLGTPMQIASAVWFWQERDYDRVVSMVQGQVGKHDWVYCEPAAYYPVKAMADKVFMTHYDKDDRFFTPEEKRRISVMVIDASPWEFERARTRLGGTWAPAGEPVRRPKGGFLFFRVNFGDHLAANYNLQAYRRTGDQANGLSRGQGPGPAETHGKEPGRDPDG
jgi:hypothetical protein